MKIFPFTKSWKTTVVGLVVLLIVVGSQWEVLTDGDPSTQIDWTQVVTTLGLVLVAFFARDADTSSEASAIK